MEKIPIGLVGTGRIAHDQHIPVILASNEFALVACTNRSGDVAGIETFYDIEKMQAVHPEIEAVTITAPTTVHYQAAKLALEAGKHVLMEKPPCATTAEMDRLVALAHDTKRTLFQTWHQREAPRVSCVRDWLKTRAVAGGRIVWKEDVSLCHPGQNWVWQPGGYGVFDPGINAISILTKILPCPVFVEKADLSFPADCDSPVAAEIVFRTDEGARIEASMNFKNNGPPIRDVFIDTNGGSIALVDAATKLVIDKKIQKMPKSFDDYYAEYTAIYRHFAELIADGASDVDVTPLRLVADVFLIARRHTVAPINK
jgi:D-galactose 1-dehydrogenase